MGATVSAAPNQRRLLLGSAAIIAGAIAVSSLATQFVAWRVGFHPAIGAPWFGHLYAPWSWIVWQEAAWAPSASSTFQIVDAGLLASTALTMLYGTTTIPASRMNSRGHRA